VLRSESNPWASQGQLAVLIIVVGWSEEHQCSHLMFHDVHHRIIGTQHATIRGETFGRTGWTSSGDLDAGSRIVTKHRAGERLSYEMLYETSVSQTRTAEDRPYPTYQI